MLIDDWNNWLESVGFLNLHAESQAAIISSVGNFLAGFLVAGLALVGIWLQLRNDRNQRKITREMDLRKSVYLDAGEAINQSVGLLMKFSELDTDEKQLSKQFSECSSKIARVSIIGERATLDSIQALNIELGKCALKLVMKRAPIIRLKSSIDSIDETIDSHFKEQARLLELMKSLNLEGNRDSRKMDYLSDSHKYSSDQVNESITKKEQITEELHRYILDFQKECFEDTARISQEYLPDVLANIRKELELPLDTQVYRDYMSNMYSKSRNIIEEFHNDMKTYIDNNSDSRKK